jgi:uncharacterized protein
MMVRARNHWLYGRLVPGILASLWTACSPLSPRPDETQFFVLAPVASPTAPPTNAVTIGLGPVTLPAYLARPQMVTRLGPTQIDVSNYDRWAEALDGNFTRSLSQNLGALLHTNDIIQYPWYATTTLDYVVRVDVLEFEADTTGLAVLRCRWAVLDSDGSTIAGAESRYTQQATDATTASAVAALSQVVGALAHELAGAIPGAP